MSTGDYLIVGILSLFTVLSMLYQLRPILPLTWLWRMDQIGLIPNYSFFAPLPLTSDFRVVYRITDSGQQSDFKEITIYRHFLWFRFLFNPFKYYNKGLIDLCVALITEYKALDEEERNFIQISHNYLSIFRLIQHELMRSAAIHPDCELEFAIVSTKENTDRREMTVLFRSFKHRAGNIQ